MLIRVDRWVGRIIDGRYRIERLLERGGMGAVFLAKHQRIDREVAVKIVTAEATAGRYDLRRLAREARAVNLIGHPNIVDVIDFGWVDDRSAYLVMELLVGESLATRLTRVGRLPLDHACTILTQVAFALEAAHERGVVHRDVKPGNIFLAQIQSRHDVVKVLDFGLASLREVDGRSSDLNLTDGSVIGTPEYIAPEQARGRRVDHRADIFGLGVTFYAMLAGCPPFYADNPISTVLKILHDDYVPVSDLVKLDASAQVDEIIALALRKDPEERMSSARAFRRHLVELRGRLDKPTRRRFERIDAPQRRQYGAWVANEGGRTVIELAGVIDERADLKSLNARIGTGELHLRLRRVQRINSAGYQQWVSWMRSMRNTGIKIVCHECSPAVVRQASMAEDFIGKHEIETMYAPYYCDECDAEQLGLLSAADVRAGRVGGPVCSSCGETMTFDEVAQTYFLCVLGT